ncbi:MAG TPA: hypothetical protein VK889_02445 [Solirubrobacterales bacterium]|nr:hypothetical protein [Solirubrobacterales bacterium]
MGTGKSRPCGSRLHVAAGFPATLLVLLLSALVLSPLAKADDPKVILSTFGSLGSAGGQFSGLGPALAVNRTGAGGVTAGDFYALDIGNRRIQQFSKTGSLIRAWGMDVVESGPGNAGTGFEICVVANGDVCKAATSPDSPTAGTVAGTLGGIAVDQATGLVYSTHPLQKRVDVFSATGQFEGAFGWKVTGAEELGFCTTPCQAGLAGGKGGQFNAGATSPRGIGVNPQTGRIVVADSGGLRIQEFEPTLAAGKVTGVSFVGAFGWDVVESGPSNANQIENVVVKASGGDFKLSFGGQTTADLDFDASAAEVDAALEALPNIGANEVSVTGGPGNATGSNPYAITFVGPVMGEVANGPITAASGTDPLQGTVTVPPPMNVGGAAQFEVCTPSDVCKAGVPGAGAGQLSGNTAGAGANLMELAVDSRGAIYVLNSSESACDATNKLCRVQRFAPSGRFAEDFAPGALRKEAFNGRAQSIAVDPVSDHVFVSVHPPAPVSKYEVQEYDTSGALVATSPANSGESLTNGTVTFGAIAVGVEELLYFSAPQRVFTLGPLPPAEVSEPTCDVPVATEAICSGTVTVPATASGAVATVYRFEYSSNGVDWARFPEEDAALSQIAGPQAVEQTIKPLEPNTLYQVRLCATTSSTVCSGPVQVKTPTAGPAVLDSWVEEVTQTEAVLGAEVNPQGLATSYYFEWGETPAYGNRVPAFNRQIGAGKMAVIAQEPIDGLAPGSTYHYRIVARNAATDPGFVFGLAREFETLNACGLIDARCYELVSPARKGPNAVAGKNGALGGDMQFQAAAEAPGIAYTVAAGFPDATAGSEVLYRGLRSASGWHSSQLSPPALVASQQSQDGATVSRTKALSDDLSCGVVVTAQPLSPDAPEQIVEAGGGNLYVQRNGVYEPITYLPPSNMEEVLKSLPNNFEEEEYDVLGMSDDCNQVVFRTPYAYPGIAPVPPGQSRVYEWDEGSLRALEIVPTGGGSEAVAQSLDLERQWNILSDDGSKAFFSATSQAGDDAGNTAVFVRKNGTKTVNVSQAAPDGTLENQGATYQTASDDGRYVFFLANYGLTADSSSGLTACNPVNASATGSGAGCELYRFDVETDTLTAISADSNPADKQGPGVAGVLDISEDGTSVYFAARGQLIPGEGRTYNQNISQDTYNVFYSGQGGRRFVGVVRSADLITTYGGVLAVKVEAWQSRATPDGQFLLFNSAANVTGYQSGGAVMVYRYSVADEKTECVSCRRDGLPSVAPFFYEPLQKTRRLYSSVMITADGSRVFFRSLDDLANGAVSGRPNLYQWKNGQVALLSTEVAGQEEDLRFAGASADGTDVYFSTSVRHNAEDLDEASDVYDARRGGGFPVAGLPPSPPVPPTPCDPLEEGACQGPTAPAQVPGGPPASSAVSGAGNQASTQPIRCKKGFKKKKVKGKVRCVKAQKKKQSRGTKKKQGQARHANTDRGISK